MRPKKKLEMMEIAPFGVVTSRRGMGNYLQRLEQFEKAIHSYDEALRWNNTDLRSLLARCLARAKSTHYSGACADIAAASEIEPNNIRVRQIRAKIEYEKCAFERALVLAHRGRALRKLPPDFTECAQHAEETIRECVSKSASKVLQRAIPSLKQIELKMELYDADQRKMEQYPRRISRMAPLRKQQIQEISRGEKQKYDRVSRLLASKYLERMAHDKYFLTALCKDERLVSANKQGSKLLQELANKALADLVKRQEVLRERKPLYAAQAAGSAARDRLVKKRKEYLQRAQQQHTTNANRLLQATVSMLEEKDTAKCLENAEFAMEQISRIPAKLLPSKDRFLQELYDAVANAFLDQKRVSEQMCEGDRERRAFVLLGLEISRPPSHDSILKVRPPAPPRDVKSRLTKLERALTMSSKPAERCYILHELGRHQADMKQAQKTRVYSMKCQTEARASGQRAWLLNASFLLARGNILQNNRPEARAALLEGVGLAKSWGMRDVAAFFETCANVSMEGELASDGESLEKREKAMVSLMQDDDLRSAAEHLFRRMSTIPAGRRFSVMPGVRVDETAAPNAGRRVSIMPKSQQPTRVTSKKHNPLGFQDFDI